jgi:hypothetical protein
VINEAIDEARRIFGRITTYTIYRIALTMDIMFVDIYPSSNGYHIEKPTELCPRTLNFIPWPVQFCTKQFQ